MKRTLIILIIFFSAILALGDNTWSTNGPSVARVTCITPYPDNSQRLYIGTAENGVYSSENGGDQWHHLDSDILPRNIRRIVLHPLGSETLYVSTTDGLYISRDSGQNWSICELPNHYRDEISGFLVHPLRPNIIFCNGGPQNYRSIDGGNTWQELNVSSLFIQKFIVDPVNDSLMYFITHSGIYSRSVYKSYDIGETWECIHNDLSTTMTTWDIEIDPDDNDVIYVAGGDAYNPSAACLAISDNGGESWIDISPPNLSVKLIFNICISPLDNNTLFACSVSDGLLKSTDYGQTWESVNGNLDTPFAYQIYIDQITGAYYLSVLYQGLYKSIDNGEHWQKISSNLNHAECTGIALNNTTGEIFVSTVREMFYSNDSGNTWTDLEIDWPIPNCELTSNLIIDSYDSRYIYGCYSHLSLLDDGGIYRSSDGGETWQFFNDSLPGNCFFNSIALSDFGNGFRRLFLATESGLYFSDDLAVSWTQCSNGIPYNGPFYRVEASKCNPEIVFAYDFNLVLYRSTDCGMNWEEIQPPPEGYYCNELKCDPVNPEGIYVCMAYGGLFHSLNTGDSWINITNDIPHYENYLFLSGLAINPYNTQNLFVNSHHFGIFQSHDEGESWEAFNDSLNILYSCGITIIDPSDTNRIYLATNEQSVWSIYRTPTGIDENITLLPLELAVKSYPNPFNAAARISFTLPEAGQTKADIYDILGRHVATVVDSYLFPGQHSVVWRPEDISTGVYYLQVAHQDHIFKRKLLYIK